MSSECQCRLVCMCCKAELQPAQPGHEDDIPSHGLGSCCWDQYRAENGLPKREYPQEARTR